MQITADKLRKIIKEEINFVSQIISSPKIITEHWLMQLKEDYMDDEKTRYTVSKARDAEEPGMMGIDPDDMKQEILEQFSITAGALVTLLKEVRVMREMAGEMSQMEAEGAIRGSFGTRMWHAVSSVDKMARTIVREWNKLNDIY